MSKEDVEYAYEYAREIVESEVPFAGCPEAMDIVLEGYKRSERLRWHNLAKDPGDLPTDEREKLVVVKHSYSDVDGYRKVTTAPYLFRYEKWVIDARADGYYQVIAWQNIELDEEES